MDASEMTRRMGYHPVASSGQKQVYEANRSYFIQLANYLVTLGPDTREKSLALTALQEALMWANAHVACNAVGANEGDLYTVDLKPATVQGE